MSKKTSTKRVVTVSFMVDLLDIITNLIVAVLTGSAVIFAEMIQGLSDSLGSFLLVVGQKRSRKPRDIQHPLGHSREVFFWALLSSMVMLTLGSGLTIWRGYHQFISPQPIENKFFALSVLILSVITNGYAFHQSMKKIYIDGISFIRSFKESSNQLVKTALLRNSLGVLSAIVGLVAMLFYNFFGILLFDAIGAIMVGILMIIFAIILITQARNLITGQSVPKKIKQKIRQSTLSIPEVVAINRLSAVYTGSEEILVDIDLDLKEKLTTTQIEKTLDRIKQAIVKEVPEVKNLRVDLNSPTIKEEVKIKKAQ